MALLAVHDPRLRLSFRAGRWTVLRGRHRVQFVRAHEVDEIHLFGPVGLDPAARAAALARGVPVTFLTADGRYRGRLSPRDGLHARRALSQLRWLQDDDRRLILARQIVAGKVANQRKLLVRAQAARRSERIAEAAARLRAVLRAVDRAQDLDELRGLEGHAAALYFGVWDELLLHPRIGWSGRTRRPPRDPANACLGLGYTLLANKVRAAVQKAGLAPQLGALHETSRDQDALVFDLVEEFRGVAVDQVVLRLLNRRQLDVHDFEDPRYRQPAFTVAGELLRDDARPVVYLARPARSLFLAELARRWRDRLRDHLDPGSQRTLEDLLDRQIWQLCHVFDGGVDRYRPFPLP